MTMLQSEVRKVMNEAPLTVPNTEEYILFELAQLVSDNTNHYDPKVKVLMGKVRQAIEEHLNPQRIEWPETDKAKRNVLWNSMNRGQR